MKIPEKMEITHYGFRNSEVVQILILISEKHLCPLFQLKFYGCTFYQAQFFIVENIRTLLIPANVQGCHNRFQLTSKTL